MPVTINGSGPIAGVTSINTTVSDTELGYLDGVTSALQTQINAKLTTPGAWTSWTPTVTATSGSYTTITATGAYIQVGKIVTLRATVTVTNKGTAASYMQIALPVTQKTGAQFGGCGAETAANGKALSVQASAGTIYVAMYDGTTPWVNTYVINVSLTYEAE